MIQYNCPRILEKVLSLVTDEKQNKKLFTPNEDMQGVLKSVYDKYLNMPEGNLNNFEIEIIVYLVGPRQLITNGNRPIHIAASHSALEVIGKFYTQNVKFSMTRLLC